MSLLSKKIRYELLISGMQCEKCEEHVQDVLKEIKGAKKVDADYKTGKILIECKNPISNETFQTQLEKVNKTFISLTKLD